MYQMGTLTEEFGCGLTVGIASRTVLPDQIAHKAEHLQCIGWRTEAMSYRRWLDLAERDPGWS